VVGHISRCFHQHTKYFFVLAESLAGDSAGTKGIDAVYDPIPESYARSLSFTPKGKETRETVFSHVLPSFGGE
jgi:hypothetical protein